MKTFLLNDPVIEKSDEESVISSIQEKPDIDSKENNPSLFTKETANANLPEECDSHKEDTKDLTCSSCLSGSDASEVQVFMAEEVTRQAALNANTLFWKPFFTFDSMKNVAIEAKHVFRHGPYHNILGQGLFSEVRKVHLKALDNTVYAARTLRLIQMRLFDEQEGLEPNTTAKNVIWR